MNLRPALFLDRDGVINRERGEHTWRLEDFEVLPDVAEAIREATRAGWATIVITNQSGIGLGLYGHADVLAAHRKLHETLAAQGAALTDIYYCPHHPTSSKCLCRKPGGLMLERAIAAHGIDVGRSVMVGDKPRDVQAAESVGVKGVLVEANAPILPVLRKYLGLP
ncbi:MAG TPA: HAD family hydrolase [Flavobacteriales bacterium]|nr:HAD family hydrolase [Flavobacteriales bacterium]